jgi:hypothetical protein
MIPLATISDDLPEDDPGSSGPITPAGDAAKAETIADNSVITGSYYDGERKEYLIKNRRSVWLSLGETAFKRHLKSAGISSKVEDGQVLSGVDQQILDVQHDRDIQYSGRLCGKKEGFYTEGQTRFLVTDSYRLPETRPGEWPILNAIIGGLLGNNTHGQTQVEVFHGWMQIAQIALRAGRIQAAQALAIAGPVGCGKSLLQNLITTCLGGRVAKPHRYMTGDTPFNGELFEAEHLMLEDEFMSRSIRDRLKLGAALKNFCVATRAQSCHRKGRQAITLPAWWRLSITLNDDPEAMLVLPPLDDHIADKLILLRASCFDFPMPMDSAEAQQRCMEACITEIPSYLHWLIHDFRIPGHLQETRRYGIASWHHPQLKVELDNLSPEADLLALIDEVLWSPATTSWSGTSEELRRILLESSVEFQARRLLEWRNACGTFLGRLAAKPNSRVELERTATRRGWIIFPPPSFCQGSDSCASSRHL